LDIIYTEIDRIWIAYLTEIEIVAQVPWTCNLISCENRYTPNLEKLTPYMVGMDEIGTRLN